MIYKTSNGWEIVPLISFFLRAFLVRKGDMNILVDTGRKSMRKRLFRQLRQQGVEDIRVLMLTHAHFDHTENAAAVKQKFGADIIINELEAPFLREGKSNTISGTRGFASWLTRTFRSRILDMYHYEPVIPDITFDDEYVIPGSDGALKCIHIPGHTPGSSAMIVDGEIALAGDTMAHHLPGSIFPPFGEDRQKIVKSWKVLLDNGCRLYLPVHGKPVSRARLEKELKKMSHVPTNLHCW